MGTEKDGDKYGKIEEKLRICKGCSEFRKSRYEGNFFGFVSLAYGKYTNKFGENMRKMKKKMERKIKTKKREIKRKN